MAGLVADGRQLVNRAREEALSYKKNFGSSVPPHVLADRMGQYVHYYTLYGSIRPFGASIMLAGYDADLKKPVLSVIEPSGVTHVSCLSTAALFLREINNNGGLILVGDDMVTPFRANEVVLSARASRLPRPRSRSTSSST